MPIHIVASERPSDWLILFTWSYFYDYRHLDFFLQFTATMAFTTGGTKRRICYYYDGKMTKSLVESLYYSQLNVTGKRKNLQGLSGSMKYAHMSP